MSLETEPPAQRQSSWLARAVQFPLTRLAAALVLYPVFLSVFHSAGRLVFSRLDSLLALKLVEASAAITDLLVVALVMERRPLRDLGFRGKQAFRVFFLGTASGGALMSVVFFFMALAGWYHVTGMGTGARNWLDFGSISVALLLAAVAEEIVFRALTFRLLEECAGSWLALVTSSVYFAWAHGHYPTSSPASSAGIVMAGLMLGLAYMATRNLWFVIGLHWSWNIFQGPIYGAPVSGHQLHGLINVTIEGPERWTGGAFGPEAGLPVLAVCVVFAIVAATAAVRNGEVRNGKWFGRRKGPRNRDGGVA
ncbi:MAG: CPBP family intramembrane metalloprotease [Candidatus Hydrogenedentes bacterium]|nr:CPBP family intramembrane metalloprotease [Candidatus Hydrogenedentota bacterium]